MYKCKILLLFSLFEKAESNFHLDKNYETSLLFLFIYTYMVPTNNNMCLPRDTIKVYNLRLNIQ